MSFTFSCYYLLSKKTIDSQSVGDISGPFTLAELATKDILYTEISTTILFQRTDYLAKMGDFVVAIPNKNGNNVPKNRIYIYMATYNIPELLSIKPYVKLAGNDVGEGSHIDTTGCIDPVNRKKLALLHNRNSILPLTRSQKYAILANGNMSSYRHCML